MSSCPAGQWLPVDGEVAVDGRGVVMGWQEETWDILLRTIVIRIDATS